MRGDGAYLPGMVTAASRKLGDSGRDLPSPPRRRRLPSSTEQSRRKAWGAEWGKVGAAYKRARLARER